MNKVSLYKLQAQESLYMYYIYIQRTIYHTRSFYLFIFLFYIFIFKLVCIYQFRPIFFVKVIVYDNSKFINLPKKQVLLISFELFILQLNTYLIIMVKSNVQIYFKCNIFFLCLCTVQIKSVYSQIVLWKFIPNSFLIVIQYGT